MATGEYDMINETDQKMGRLATLLPVAPTNNNGVELPDEQQPSLASNNKNNNENLRTLVSPQIVSPFVSTTHSRFMRSVLLNARI